MNKIILLGGPRDGTLLSVTSAPPDLLTMPEFEPKQIWKEPHDEKVLNTPIPLVQYERFSVSFPVDTGMIFYFYRGTV